jgi:two-component system, cell cycle sensor histidine kinase and response regulator CckA
MDKGRILIVEDERIVAEDLRFTLESEGYAVVGLVASGEQAVARATELQPDLVLMDVNLDGEMDGISAAAAIRRQQGTPVIYLTAFSNPQTLGRARETDAFGFIVKPFQERAVIAAIEMALGKHGKERARQRREEMIRSGLMTLPLGVIMTDEADRIIFANATARHHIGRALDGENGVPLGEVFIPALAAPAEREGGAPEDVRGAILEMTGRRLEVAYSEEPLRAEDGRQIGRIIAYQDAEHPPLAGELGRILHSFLQASRSSPNSPEKYVTICAWSKRIKVDADHWVSFEDFLTHYVGLSVTHGMSPDVAREWKEKGAAAARAKPTGG